MFLAAPEAHAQLASGGGGGVGAIPVYVRGSVVVYWFG